MSIIVYFISIGFQEVYKFLHQKNVRTILLRNFNQDSLGNFFGAMHAHGYRNNNLTFEMFAASYRTLLLNNLMWAHSPGSNWEEDFSEGILTSFQSLFNIYADANKTEDEKNEIRVADGAPNFNSSNLKTYTNLGL